MTTGTWSSPTEVTDVQIAFPADALDRMPPRDECEEALALLPPDEERMWRNFQREWFFNGLPGSTVFDVKEGIDPEIALRHLASIQGSFAPQHEHKESAVAFLASLWFESVRYDGDEEELPDTL